ncbi:lipid-A-disaccharide synthase-related protein [Chroogloeocystis siderophila]|jgi:uncharacterized protein (TIGR03492 family)|uniref:Lipid-A-disaccharide synthase n=1 Tax=Chroogloeocystis siderophila 5.2 s.c.1 TaxID=247279 RepID=A0A1U7HBC0_9CHRO|nr:lipid-A-disaccharide synthase-related protein [Chroogloeocystis siderophila]OKH20873.1 hypothetical protein NIES1031_22680 [Chroogloeocystis siderophila 5.2 s.c.1]
MNNLSAFSPDSPIKLLCLSNGHGEDVIAVRILQELQQLTAIDIAALPIVGEGRAYTQFSIPIIGKVQIMPSGGFIYMDGRQVLRDLQGGLLKLTLSQIKVVRSWAKQGGAILAVGDIVPLLFAWASGANYAFVGTAKSEYYRKDELGWHSRRSLLSRLENLSASVYHPFDRYLMRHPRCKAVFPRDTLTTKTLKKWAIPAFDLGNPMMDRLEAQNLLKLEPDPQRLTILLLPGSRPPEAYANWQQILVAVTELIATFPTRSLVFLAAIAPTLTLELLCQSLVDSGFAQDGLTFKHKNASIILTQNAYNDCLHQADLAIAMAGTATEQFIGLGKCAIAFPGNGPQYTYAFAEAQSRHLGSSLTLVEHPKQVADAVRSLLQDPQKLEQIAKNGYQRMGQPGAAHRIAQCLVQQFGWLPE